MYISFIILFFIMFIILTVYKRIMFLKNIKRNYKKKILGFQVMGIGNGHISQAKTVYNILIKNYEVPIVIIYGAKKEDKSIDNYFNKSKIVYKEIKSTPETTNNMNLLYALIDAFKKKETSFYEKKFMINTWINFFVPDLFNFRTNQINIANQFDQNDIRIYLVIIIYYILSHVKIVTIHNKSLLSPYTITTLVDFKKIDRSIIDPRLVLCYSGAGKDFSNQLKLIAIKNPNYNFKYFTDTELDRENLPNNIELFKPDKEKFNNYIKSCVLVLCTSGNELIQECVYNYIPIASMPCSKKQFEQMYNYKKYLANNYIKPMYQLDIENIINNTDYSINDKFHLENKDRDKKILSIMSKLIDNPPFY